MDARRLIVGVCVATALSTAHAHRLADYSEAELFSNYALALCLADAYRGQAIAEEAVAAMSGFREFGSAPLEAYHALNPLLGKWRARPYQTKSGKDNDLARCIDFSRSREVAEALPAGENWK
jgi:hypothetical protein